MLIRVPTAQINSLTIHREGETVTLIYNGRRVCDLDWQAADEVARALIIQARKAEVEAKAEQIAYDQAILIRKGIPLGLTNRRDIQHEAGKLAAWDSKLRRYMPGGVKSKAIVGTPAVIRHKPRKRDE